MGKKDEMKASNPFVHFFQENMGILVALAALCIFLEIMNQRFFTWSNWLTILDNVSKTGFLAIGIMLCIIAAIPMLILSMSGYSNNTDVLPIVGVDAMLVTIAIGVKMIVLTCIRHDGYDKLLEEGDYTRLNKKAGKYDGIYWGIALAVYLGWSFVTNRWETTWIVWPIAGVLFVVYREIVKAIVRAVNKK